VWVSLHESGQGRERPAWRGGGGGLGVFNRPKGAEQAKGGLKGQEGLKVVGGEKGEVRCARGKKEFQGKSYTTGRNWV